MKLSNIKQKVSAAFYTHGLFCSSHPFAIISMVIVFALLTCIPLARLPLPGNAPLLYTTPLSGYIIPSVGPLAEEQELRQLQPIWYQGEPLAYVQQIVIRSVVHPWDARKLAPGDAFRAPLSRAFNLVEHVANHQLKEDKRRSLTLSDLCYHVTETMSGKKLHTLFPSYNCLLVSPANFWGQSMDRFMADTSIVKTVLKSHTLETPPSIRDILFGTPSHSSGMKRFYIRNRQRVVTYSLTVVFKQYDKQFISSLRRRLVELHPLSTMPNNTEPEMVHLYFKKLNFVVEYTPLLLAYFILFMYIYFSVRKIEMVKSKWGLALSAVMTVMSSLAMSIGACAFFGFTPSLAGSEIFPYLAVIIGFENVVVVTKSIVSTPPHLDVKLRVANGLANEGWFILKNLMMELFVLIIGCFTFVSAIQEFCLFAVVGLLTDFFLQMFFYTTVVSIDLRRMELSDLKSPTVHRNEERVTVAPVKCPVMSHFSQQDTLQPRIYVMDGEKTRSYQYQQKENANTPKRLKVMNFWARTRLVQRAMTVCFVLWLCCMFHTSGLYEQLAELHENFTTNGFPVKRQNSIDKDDTEYLKELLKRVDQENWKQLSHAHWSSLFENYNISVRGRYLTLLPEIDLSIAIPPDESVRMRNPREESVLSPDEAPPTGDDMFVEAFNWKDRSNIILTKLKYMNLHRYPRTGMEVLVGCTLVVLTTVLAVYGLVLLYRCMCSRNYARWRSAQLRKSRKPYTRALRETVPLHLRGHAQQVECLDADGPLVVSACLGGEIRVWDHMSGECINTIFRTRIVPMAPDQLVRHAAAGRNINDSDADLFAECHDQEVPLGKHSIPSPPTGRSPPNPIASVSPQTAPPVATKTTHRRNRHVRNRSADLTQVVRARTSRSRAARMEELSPDLSGTIDADFRGLAREKAQFAEASPITTLKQSPMTSLGSSPAVCLPSPVRTPKEGFDFSSFDQYFKEHAQFVEEQKEYVRQKSLSLVSSSVDDSMQSLWEDLDEVVEQTGGRRHSLSSSVEGGAGLEADEDDDEELSAPAVWCLACQDNLIVTGCGNGRLEIWDALTGSLKCHYSNNTSGVTEVCMIKHRIIAARMDGSIDFLELETFLNLNKSKDGAAGIKKPFFKKGHYKRSSYGAGDMKPLYDDVIHCTIVQSVQAHQRPITYMGCENGRTVTASQDRTLKVYRLEDQMGLFTLHGHNGDITTIFLDKGAPMAAASGCSTGAVRLWDLLTGSCVHKLCWHSAPVLCITATPAHVVSAAQDDRLCVWERCKGTLLHWLELEPACVLGMAMLTSNLLVTGGQGLLRLWDISQGTALRSVQLDDSSGLQEPYVRRVKVSATALSGLVEYGLQVMSNSSIACEFGRELRVVHFSSVLEKND